MTSIEPSYTYFNGPTPATFSFIFVFSYNKEKYLVASGNQTRIFGAIGKSVDHQTTTTARLKAFLCYEGLEANKRALTRYFSSLTSDMIILSTIVLKISCHFLHLPIQVIAQSQRIQTLHYNQGHLVVSDRKTDDGTAFKKSKYLHSQETKRGILGL